MKRTSAYKALLLPILLLAVTFSSCKDEEQDYSLCQQGTIIGKIRSGGGGPAVSVNSTVFGKHSWRGYNNVVEALNLKQNYASGTKIYFKARPATEEEKSYIITADGDESAKPVIFVTAVSTDRCP